MVLLELIMLVVIMVEALLLEVLLQLMEAKLVLAQVVIIILQEMEEDSGVRGLVILEDKEEIVHGRVMVVMMVELMSTKTLKIVILTLVVVEEVIMVMPMLKMEAPLSGVAVEVVVPKVDLVEIV